MTFEEFRAEIQRQKEPRRSKIKNSVGVRQAYLFLQKRKWEDVGQHITEKQFQQIVRKVNEELGRLFIEKKILTLPHQMGTLEVRTAKNQARYTKDGRLTLPKIVNWDATLKLWNDDAEAFKDKILIRDMHPQKIRIIYDRTTANYNNKNYFDFIVNRGIVRTLSSMMRDGTLETFLIDEPIY